MYARKTEGFLSVHCEDGARRGAKGGTDMDIAGVSMALSGISTQSQVSTAVLSKAMDTNETLGEGLVQMLDAAAMEQSVNPTVGGNFDMRV